MSSIAAARRFSTACARCDENRFDSARLLELRATRACIVLEMPRARIPSATLSNLSRLQGARCFAPTRRANHRAPVRKTEQCAGRSGVRRARAARPLRGATQNRLFEFVATAMPGGPGTGSETACRRGSRPIRRQPSGRDDARSGMSLGVSPTCEVETSDLASAAETSRRVPRRPRARVSPDRVSPRDPRHPEPARPNPLLRKHLRPHRASPKRHDPRPPVQ